MRADCQTPGLSAKQSTRRGRPLQDALLFCLLVILLLLPLQFMTACETGQPKRYSYSFTGTFDTVISIIGYTHTERQFNDLAALAEERFQDLHRLYDIYHTYPDINNLCTINRQAGIAPVAVDRAIIDLLLFGLEMDRLAPGVINIAFGPVLAIWHDYRTRALEDQVLAVPGEQELLAAARLCDAGSLVIDQAAGTVFLPEPGMKLDLGAIAKGYATELVARELEAAGLTSGIISAGGSNVRLIGQPDDGRATWQIGLQNPDGNPLIPDDPPLDVLLVNDLSVVTSGDYQRYYEVDGVIYHHLIDTRTLQPARYFRAVTVLMPDSGQADFFSTALFLMPYAEGRQLVESLPDCEALWIFPDGQIEATEGMLAKLKSHIETSGTTS